MKNNLKIVIAFVLGVLISGISVYAVTQINASQVTYTDTNNQETTVESALNYLYNNVGKIDTSKFIFTANSYEGQKIKGSTTSINLNAGTYLVTGIETWPSPVSAESNNNTPSANGTINHPAISYNTANGSCTRLNGWHSRVILDETYDNKLYRQYSALNTWVCKLNQTTEISIVESLAGASANNLPMSVIIQTIKLD